MSKTIKNKTRKKRTVWVFQPEPDVIELVSEALGRAPKRGEMTALLNQAVRLKHKEAKENLAKAAKILGKDVGTH